MKTINIADALHSLAPGAEWKYNDEDYSTLVWLSEDIEIPSEEAVVAEIARLQQVRDEEQAALAAQEAAKEAAKQSALQKLSNFGITEEEAKALFNL